MKARQDALESHGRGVPAAAHGRRLASVALAAVEGRPAGSTRHNGLTISPSLARPPDRQIAKRIWRRLRLCGGDGDERFAAVRRPRATGLSWAPPPRALRGFRHAATWAGARCRSQRSERRCPWRRGGHQPRASAAAAAQLPGVPRPPSRTPCRARHPSPPPGIAVLRASRLTASPYPCDPLAQGRAASRRQRQARRRNQRRAIYGMHCR
eukprot:scaffold31815_cov118-Isochrysis_galbana.AAC.3